MKNVQFFSEFDYRLCLTEKISLILKHAHMYSKETFKLLNYTNVRVFSNDTIYKLTFALISIRIQYQTSYLKFELQEL